jgi:glycosyltransferase involved in cell wall biosynthesis
MESPERGALKMLKVLHIGVCDLPIRLSHSNNRLGLESRGIRMTWVGYTPRDYSLRPAPGGEVELHPTFSRSKPAFIRDAFHLAVKLHEQTPFGLILADDPMGSGLVGYLLGRKLKLPLLIRCHTQYFGHREWIFERPYYPFYHLLARFLLAKADQIEAASQCVARSIVRLGIEPARVKVAYPPIQSFLFSPPTVARAFSNRLLYVGQLTRGKGLFTLLDAMKILVTRGCEPQLEIVGQGPCEAALRRKAQALGILKLLSFAGFQPRSELARYYVQNDIFVLPTHYEAFARVLAEAALCGLPVIASQVGGVSEVVLPGKTALLVPPKNPRALADALATLLSDPQRARAMGAAGHEFAKTRFDFEKMTDAMTMHWRRAADNQPFPSRQATHPQATSH